MKYTPQEISQLDFAFPAQVSHLMPPQSQIPDEFKNFNSRHPMMAVFSKWMFKGLPEGTEFVAREGVNKDKALRHVITIMRSFEPKHEDKTSACAFLLDQWFSEIREPEPANP